jgi:hypothetical protein
MSNVVDIANAVVRGYVLSNCNASAAQIPFFEQVVAREERRYDPPVVEPGTNRLLFAGGLPMRHVRVDRTVELRALMATFNQLENGEKEIILDKTDFDGINQLAISQNAKNVLNGIAEASNRLHQNNPRFMDALQVVHGRRGPA